MSTHQTTQSCPKCDKQLSDATSGQVARFLSLVKWPCPYCDIGAAVIVVSENGIAAERDPLLMSVKRAREGGFTVLYGFGSIAAPQSHNAAGGRVADGATALKIMKDLFGKAKSSPDTLEAMLRQQGAY